MPQDYEELDRRGIDVKGRIVIARYGGSWRGIKPKVAAEHGALGCIIYSDPRDDGYFLGDVYPEGAWRNDTGAQRGSVSDMPLYPGDPLTPGIGLPRRPWFRHQIYAPGFYTGYGVKTLPAVREAIEQHNWTEAAEQIVVVAGVIERTAGQIDRARTILKAVGRN